MNKECLFICFFCLAVFFFSATSFAQSAGESIFSKSPIDPSDPGKSVTSFETGDYIYAVLRPGSSWKDIYQKESGFYIMVQFYVDDQKITGKPVTFKSAEAAARDYLILDIAPKPSKMTSYSNPDIEFATYDGFKFGPQEFTKILGGLPPGKHTVKVEVYNYGKTYGSGTFEIDGSDYKFYTKLNAEITENVGQNITLPPAGMVDKKLEAEMRQLAENGGWKDIETLYIKDKDWWVEQGVGRYIAAVIAAQAEDGSYFYSIVTFKQDQILTGWGPLRLDHTGARIAIPQKNIGKSSGADRSGSPFILFRLALSLALLAAGIILLVKVVEKFQDKIGTLLQPLVKMKALIGVITLGLGAAFFVKNLLVLSPLADILPQAAAVVAGLYLGLDLLLKKSVPREQSQKQETAEAVEGAEKHEDQEKTPEAMKVEEAAKAGVEKAQDFLAGKRTLIEQLKVYEVPLGAAALVFGLLHLIVGGVPLL
ncbi:MAG: hypothetical protein K9K37_05875 [Desulfocapsa sp.]|nr:hypothetical protein [Desulfocapsa sp.]